MNIEDIHRVLVVGSGTMGRQIALQCAMHGYQVLAYDVAPQALSTAAAQIQTYAEQLVSAKRLSADEAQAALTRIRFTTDPAEAARADVLSESVPEDPDLKASVFAQFHPLCPLHTIFTTNTSTLVPSMYAEATGRPAQFAAFHFYQYVWDANLVDIMPHPGTSLQTMEVLQAFARRIGQIPLVLKKESPEYVVNAILGAMWSTAFKLVRHGVASVEDVDRAVLIAEKWPLAPFAGLDVVGLDTVWHITESQAKRSGDPQFQAVADWLKEAYVDKGWLGVKSGRGFYTYPNPAYARPGFLTGEAGSRES